MKLIVTFVLLLSSTNALAKQEQFTTVQLKHIDVTEAVSILKSLTEHALSASTNNNTLIIKGAKKKTKDIVKLIQKLDTASIPLTLEFIASKKKLNFKESKNIYELNRNNVSQSMSIIERQWVTLNTGTSIPIRERTRSVDGSVTESIRYKKIGQNYLFKVHEFDGQAIIQVGVNSSSLSNNIADAIEHTKLDTTIVGKTGEWLEVSSGQQIKHFPDEIVYSTNKTNKNHIHLYIKIKK